NVVSGGGANYVSIYNSSAAGEITKFQYQTIFQNFVASATGTFDFDKDLKLNIPLKSTTLVAYDFRKSDYTQYYTYGANVPTYTPYNASQATTYKIQSDFKRPFVTYGYLVNQRFDYGELGGVSIGFRSDYSSAFGAGSKPFTFPRGDAYFRLSSLGFWDNSGLSKTILEFKLRAAYGKAGIQPQPFDRYVTLGTRAMGNGIGFYYPSAQSNPNLDVEVSTETEFGADIALDLLNGSWLKRLNISATVWSRSTDNAIWDVDTAPSTGVGTIKNNAFSLASDGFQFSLNMPVYTGSNIKWDLTTNFSKQFSKITSLNGAAPVVVLSNAGSSNYVLRAGEAIGQLYGYKMLTSVNQLDTKGNPYIPVANQSQYEVASNGFVVNSASKQPIATTDLYSLGNSFPDFNMAFINDVSFKDWLSFSVQFDWVYNSHLYNQTKSWMYRDGISSDYEKPVTIAGESGAWTSFYRGVYAAGAFNGTKDYFYEDATFLRMRNISAAVDFAKLFQMKGFRRLQLVLSGRNLMTVTNYTGFDPEVSSGSTNSAFDRGVDHSTLPNYKSYQVTLNLGL
ncbi:MAG TPA: TonB-dependent receptor, partial [Cyclobacteriaceae bacterium]|nr:TonB-dependent receptor [Cyclobacteriaceae bacterium]